MLARLRKSAENKDSGFTLIELLVVMIIIGILAAIAIPAFLSQKKKAYQSSAKSDLRSVALEVEAFMSDRSQTVPAAAQAWTLANTGGSVKTVDITAVTTSPAGPTAIGNVTSTLTGAIGFSTSSVGAYCLKAINNTESLWYSPATQFSAAAPTVSGVTCPA